MIQPVHRRLAGPGGPQPRWAGQGRGHLVRPDGHHQRQRDRQRRHHRPVHDPADEAVRLSWLLRRRGRGDSQHGRPDHAAGDGCGRLHHGRDDRRPLRRDLQGGDPPGPALFRARPSGWSISRRASVACSACPPTNCPSALAALRRDWYLVLPLAALVWLLFSGYTPLFAGTVGLGAYRHRGAGQHPSRGRSAVAACGSCSGSLLGLAASGFLRYGINAVVADPRAPDRRLLPVEGGRATLVLCRDSLADGARHALPVGLACALVGTDHRLADPHRRRLELRRLHRRHRPQQPVPVPCADDDHLPRSRYGHSRPSPATSSRPPSPGRRCSSSACR